MLSDARFETALPCSDLQRAKSFYADRLGLTAAGESPAGAFYEGRDGTRFILFPSSPLGPPGPRRRRSSTPGCSSWTRNHPPPESAFLRARHGRSLPRCSKLAFRTPTRHRARTGNLEGS